MKTLKKVMAHKARNTRKQMKTRKARKKRKARKRQKHKSTQASKAREQERHVGTEGMFSKKVLFIIILSFS